MSVTSPADTPPPPDAPGQPPTHPDQPPSSPGVHQRDEKLVGVLRPFIQVSGFVRKEMAQILRQPRLLLVLVVGPFLVLFLFAVGFDQQSTVLRTTFVGPEDSVYEDALEQFTDELEAYVTPVGYGSDLVAAEESLRRGETDLIVVFPSDPAETVLNGEQAYISVLHDKLDPIQQTAVDVSAQVAVQELNSIVLQELVGQAQTSMRSYEENIETATLALDALDQAVAAGDDAGIATEAAQLDEATRGLDSLASASEQLTRRLSGELSPEQEQQYADLNDSIGSLQTSADNVSENGGEITAEDVQAARESLQIVETQGELASTLDPRIIVRPFASDAENLLRDPVTVNDYFAPGAIALLVQHMVLTFAAMGLVTDRTMGLFEVFRVGPIGPLRVLFGKYLAYTVIGSAVAAALLASVTLLLDVPLRGSIVWIVVGTLGLILASIGLGLVLSLLARTDSQAVQYAMLALLAGLFFGGFFLDLDSFRYPVKIVSWLLPITYGVRLLRDVMLRGAEPQLIDLVGLATFTVVAALIAWGLLARRLRRI